MCYHSCIIIVYRGYLKHVSQHFTLMTWFGRFSIGLINSLSVFSQDYRYIDPKSKSVKHFKTSSVPSIHNIPHGTKGSELTIK